MAFKEADIQKMMKNLDLSREEAIQLLQDDEDDVSVELTAEQKKVAKTMAQGDRKKETTPRKRERKIDGSKRSLITALADTLADVCGAPVDVVNPEREISFVYRDELFKLTLSKPRVKKGILLTSVLCSYLSKDCSQK